MSDQDDAQDESTKPDSVEESQRQRAAGVSRMLTGEDPPQEPETNDPDPPREVGGASSAGESMTRRGESISERDGKEAGREDTGVDDTPAQRPTGTSTERDQTGVNPGGGGHGSESD
jgi:hypothetical protein